jgi:hypothetical protein
LYIHGLMHWLYIHKRVSQSDFVTDRLKGLAEEVGFEPTARSNSSIDVRERPCRAQKAHRESTEIRTYTLSSASSAVNSAVNKRLLMRGYNGYDSSFRSAFYTIVFSRLLRLIVVRCVLE